MFKKKNKEPSKNNKSEKTEVKKVTIDPLRPTRKHKIFGSDQYRPYLSVAAILVICFVALCMSFYSWDGHYNVLGGFKSDTSATDTLEDYTVDEDARKTVFKAIANRFETGNVYQYTLTQDGYTQAIVAVSADGSTYVDVPVVYSDDSETVDDSDVVYLNTDYISPEGVYYKANITPKEDDVTEGVDGSGTAGTTTSASDLSSAYDVEWVNYGEASSKLSQIKTIYTDMIEDNILGLELVGKTDISPELLDIDLYRLRVPGEVFKEILGGSLITTYKAIINEATIQGDTSFKEYNQRILNDVNMSATYSDGYIEFGVKEEKLYYMGLNTGGGGHIVTAQYTFNDRITSAREHPDVSNAITLYEDAKSAFDEAQESGSTYYEYEDSLNSNSETTEESGK